MWYFQHHGETKNLEPQVTLTEQTVLADIKGHRSSSVYTAVNDTVIDKVTFKVPSTCLNRLGLATNNGFDVLLSLCLCVVFLNFCLSCRSVLVPGLFTDLCLPLCCPGLSSKQRYEDMQAFYWDWNYQYSLLLPLSYRTKFLTNWF